MKLNDKDHATVQIFYLAFRGLNQATKGELFLELAKDFTEEDLEDLVDRAIISLRRNDETISLEESLKQRGLSFNDLSD